MKVSRQPAMTPGKPAGDRRAECGERPRAERIGRPHLRRRDGAHDAVDRQQRERQLDVRHGDDQAGAGVHQVDVDDLMTFRPSSSSFSMPNFCNSTVHAAVRTRIEVQNGSSTSRIMRAAVGPDRFAKSHASGKAQQERDQRDAGCDRRRCARRSCDRSLDLTDRADAGFTVSSAGRVPRADSSS